MKRFLPSLLTVTGMLLGTGLVQAQDDQGSGKVEGNIFVDANGNGKYDEGEEVPAKITLLVLKDGKWVPVQGSYTMENGHFEFDGGLPAGDYRLQFEFSGGFTRTTDSFALSGEAGASVNIPINATQQQNIPTGNVGAPPNPNTPLGIFDNGGTVTLPTITIGGATSPLGFVNLGALLGPDASAFTP